MPRCPNGTRKNKKTGKCERPKISKNQKIKALTRKQTEIISKIKKNNIPNNENPYSITQLKTQLKTTKLMQKLNVINNEIENLNEDYRLNEKQVVSILKNHNIYDDEDTKNYADIKRKLMSMKYDANYKSCFTGDKLNNLMEMVDDIIWCSHKYSDDLLTQLNKH